MNAQSRSFEEACRRAGLHYNMVGGFSFYERAETKDTIAYLKLALNPNDPVAFNRIVNTPRRGIGRTTLELMLNGHQSGRQSWKHVLPVLSVSALFRLKQCSAWNMHADRALEQLIKETPK